MIGSPYLAAGGAMLLLAGTTGAFFVGKDYGADGVRAENAKALEAAVKAKDEALVRIGQAEAKAERVEQTRQTEVREVYREIPKIVRGDPVYRNLCISDDGVQLIRRARAAANGEAPAATAGGSGAGAVGADERGPGDGAGDDQRRAGD